MDESLERERERVPEQGIVSLIAAYREKISAIHFAPALAVILILLTHFSIGSINLAGHISYADVMCFSGIGTAIAILAAKQRLRQTKNATNLVLALTVCTGTAFLLYQTVPVFHLQLALASALFEGAFVAVVSIFWFDFFSNEPMEVILLSLSFCFLGGCALAWFFLGVSPSRFAIGLIALVAFAGIALVAALKESPTPLSQRQIDTESGHSIPLLATIFVLCFAAMFSLALAGRALWHNDDAWLAVAPSALAVLIAVLFFRKIELSILAYVALSLAILSILLASFSHVSSMVVFIVATNSFVVTISLSIAFMLKAKKGSAQAPHEAGSILLIIVFAGCIAGRGLAEISLLFPDGGLKTFVPIAATIALIAGTVASMNDKSIADVVRRKLRKNRGTERTTDREKAFDSFAMQKGLGARERETLQLLLEGNSAREVAEKMFIADGTAKAHIRHVYQKLDVHDRQAMFDMVQQYIDDEQN